jgi:hypothetical protein
MKLATTFIAITFLLCSYSAIVIAAPPAPSPTANDPAELTAARAAYESALAPFQTKLDEAIKARGQRYVSDLQAIEQQTTAAGKLDALAPLKAERDAYSAGRGTAGFDADNKKVPATARELRRAYDRDITKIRTDIAATARPAAANYIKQLTELESKLVRDRKPEDVLAVRNEKLAIQQSSTDPLYGGDAAILGSWLEPSGTKVDFHPDGSVKDGTGASGKWSWESRGQRKFLLTWLNNRGKEPYELLPDGFGMIGRSKEGNNKPLSRK